MKFGKQLVTAGLAALVAGGAVVALPSQTSAQADQYERSLASVRLNSKASVVLKYFGNPNEVVIGDVGVREAPQTAGGGNAGAGANQGGGFGAPSGYGAPSGFGAPSGGRGAMGAMSAGGSRGGMATGGGLPAMGGAAPGGLGTPAGEEGGAGSFGGSGGFGAPSGYGGPPAGYGGGAPGGYGGGGSSQFGSTLSNLTPQQETTWIYNRRAGKDVVSYEFLIGNGGVVTQIRVIGYAGGNAKTRKGVALGSTYKTVVQTYGVPEQQYRVGRSLIASYKNKNHVLFQFLNQRSQTENPFSAGNKVIAITIASVE